MRAASPPPWIDFEGTRWKADATGAEDDVEAEFVGGGGGDGEGEGEWSPPEEATMLGAAGAGTEGGGRPESESTRRDMAAAAAGMLGQLIFCSGALKRH